jgi:pimeloyl-ACP methyl ester carboxylesterase
MISSGYLSVLSVVTRVASIGTVSAREHPSVNATHPPATESLVDIEGARIHLLQAGAGDPLVYLHGVGDDGLLLPSIAELAHHYRVVRPDHPGFLGSDPAGAESPRDVAALELAMLDRLGIDRFTLVGCSFGGWVAAEMAALAPNRIERLALIGPVGLPGDGSAPDILALGPAEMLEAVVGDPARRAMLASRPPDPVARARTDRNMAALAAVTPPGMSDPSLRERLRGVDGESVLLVWGELDGAIPVSYAKDWLDALPGAELVVVPGAGHLPHAEAPEAFLELTGWRDTARAHPETTMGSGR